jgi:hypothetical protein
MPAPLAPPALPPGAAGRPNVDANNPTDTAVFATKLPTSLSRSHPSTEGRGASARGASSAGVVVVGGVVVVAGDRASRAAAAVAVAEVVGGGRSFVSIVEV